MNLTEWLTALLTWAAQRACTPAANAAQYQECMSSILGW